MFISELLSIIQEKQIINFNFNEAHLWLNLPTLNTAYPYEFPYTLNYNIEFHMINSYKPLKIHKQHKNV